MNTLPTIEPYGEYKSGNYGANALQVRFSSGLTLWYSYSTIIAFQDSWSGSRFVRENDWSTTTGKHLNWIDGGDKKSRIRGAQFEALLGATLQRLGLSTIEEGEHVHEWGQHATIERSKENERVFWCKSCEATLDEDGGIIK